MEEWFIIQSHNHGLIRSTREHIDAAAICSLFALSIKEAQALIDKMVSNLSWNDECTQSHTCMVHCLEEVNILIAKIDLLMNKLEDLGLDHLELFGSHLTCEECGETGRMGINCPITCQDVNFIGNVTKLTSPKINLINKNRENTKNVLIAVNMNNTSITQIMINSCRTTHARIPNNRSNH
jgi:hypothetical protein